MGLCGTWKETLWNAGHGTLWNMRINSQTQARTPNVPRVSATAPPTATTPRRGGCRRPDPMCAEKEDAVSSVAVQRVQIVRRPRGAAASRLQCSCNFFFSNMFMFTLLATPSQQTIFFPKKSNLVQIQQEGKKERGEKNKRKENRKKIKERKKKRKFCLYLFF